MRPQPPRSSFSVMRWQMFRLLHGKHEFKLQTLANQWRSMKASELFQKYPKTPDFDHWNYRLFERILSVPGTSNNRGLTVFLISQNVLVAQWTFLHVLVKKHKCHQSIWNSQYGYIYLYIYPFLKVDDRSRLYIRYVCKGLPKQMWKISRICVQ